MTSAPPLTDTSHNAPERPRIAHEYRRVYDDWAHVVFREGQTLLVSHEGAVDLSSGRISFERHFENAQIYEGDSVWFADGFSPMSACPRPSVLVQLVGDAWRPRRAINVHDLIVSPWLPGSSLAAVVPRRSGPPWGYELLVLEKNRPPPTAERAGRSRSPACHTRLSEVAALEAFASGEIFVFGSECPLVPREPEASELEGALSEEELDGPPQLVVESWSRGTQRSKFTALPLRELTSSFGVDARDIWVAGSVDDDSWGIVHFDGASWTLLPERFEAAVRSLIVPSGERGSNARRLYLFEKQLFEFSGGRTLEHALPERCEPLRVQRHDEALWLLCSVGEYDVALYTNDLRVQSFEFPKGDDRQRVTWNEKTYPPLVPQKRQRPGCGASAHEKTFSWELEPKLQPAGSAGR